MLPSSPMRIATLAFLVGRETIAHATHLLDDALHLVFGQDRRLAERFWPGAQCLVLARACSIGLRSGE